MTWGRLTPKSVCLFVSCFLAPFNPVVSFPAAQPNFDRLDAVIFPPRPPAGVKQPFPGFLGGEPAPKPRLVDPLVRLDDAKLSPPGHSFQDKTQLFPPRSYHFHIRPIKPQEQMPSNASHSPVDSSARDSKVKQRFTNMFFNSDAYFPPIPDLPPPPRSPSRQAQRKRIRSEYDHHQFPQIQEFPTIPRWMEMLGGNNRPFPYDFAKDTIKNPMM